MADELFCVMHNESDGYTYFSESLMGIFFSKDEAETALLELIEKLKCLEEANKARDAAYQALRSEFINAPNKQPGHLMRYQERSKELDATRQEIYARYGLVADESLCSTVVIDTNLDNWEIKPVEVGMIHMGGA